MAFYKVGNVYYSDELYHYGIKGQKHGVRRFQNEDGSLTAAGRNRYGIGETIGNFFSNRDEAQAAKKAKAASDAAYRYAMSKSGRIVTNGRGGTDAYILNERDANLDKVYADKARAAQEAYENHPLTKAEKAVSDAKNWANQTGQNVGNAASKAVSNARYFVNQVGNKISAPVSKAVSDAKNYVDKNITGNSAAGEKASNLHKAYIQNLNDEEDKYWAKPEVQKKLDQRSEDTQSMYREKAANAQREYNESLAGKAEKAASDAKKWVDQAGKDASKAADDAKKWTEQAAKDVGKAASDVGKAVGKAASDVGKATSKAAKDVVNWGGDAVKKGSNFISGLFGKKKK